MKNSLPLSLHVPEPKVRPGDEPDFSSVRVPPAGATLRPEIDVDPSEIRDLAYGLIRVMDDDGHAVGPWNPKLEPEALRAGLRAMMLTRAYDDRLYRVQRQGKISFYIKCRGEEAVAVAWAVRRSSMLIEPAAYCTRAKRRASSLWPAAAFSAVWWSSSAA